MIRWDKPLQSTNGNSARYIGEILSTNKNNKVVAVTYVKDDTKWESVFIVNEDGYGTGPGGNRISIQNVTKSGWVAIRQDKIGGKNERYVGMAIYDSKEECERNNQGTLDVVKIEWVE